jgi:hypothetical protein
MLSWRTLSEVRPFHFATFLTLALASIAMAGLVSDGSQFEFLVQYEVECCFASNFGTGDLYNAGVLPDPTFCIDPSGDNCASSGLTGGISIADTFLNTSQITFSFTGTENEDFTLYLAILDPPLTSASYDSGALNVGTFELAALTGSVLTFTGTPGGISNAVGGGSVVFDVTAIDDTEAPEPASMLLVGFGLAGLTIAAMRWRPAGR